MLSRMSNMVKPLGHITSTKLHAVTGYSSPWRKCALETARPCRLHISRGGASSRRVSCQAGQTETNLTLFQHIMRGARLTRAAHLAWQEFILEGDVVVDATAGNGFDTVFLAQKVKKSGTVYAFDIQAEAVEATRKKVEDEIPAESMPNVQYIRDCHSKLLDYVKPESVKLVCFNLGYYPSGDKTLTTTQSTTLMAVEASLSAISPGGLVSILAYIGHPGGPEEYEAVRSIAAELPTSHWITSEHRLINRPTSPILILFYKK